MDERGVTVNGLETNACAGFVGYCKRSKVIQTAMEEQGEAAGIIGGRAERFDRTDYYLWIIFMRLLTGTN